MKVVGTPKTEALIASFAALYGDGIIWDNRKNNPKHMIQNCEPQLLLLAEEDQNPELHKAVINANLSTYVINGKSRFEAFKAFEIKPAANIMQVVGGKKLDEYQHDVVLFLYNYHQININAMNGILRLCRKYKFGLFGDRPLGNNYKGVPTFEEQANLIASAKVTICLTQEDCCTTAANLGNGICVGPNDWYPELTEETLRRAIETQNDVFIQGNKQRVYGEGHTMPDRAGEIIESLGLGKPAMLDKIKEKAFNK